MIDHGQLDLFETCPPEKPAISRVVPFPLARRGEKVAKTAKILKQRKTPEGKEAFWRRTLRELADELRRHGADPNEVDRQLVAFRSAVGIELQRTSISLQRGPGAA